MIVMLDTSHDFTEASAELGCPVEQLLTPLTRYKARGERFAIDNGAFSSFDAKSFLTLLKREEHRKDLCRFVAVPDVVGSARRTLEVFDYWQPRLKGWPLALVAQDGQEHLPIDWYKLTAVFIGGTTEWKMGPHAKAIVRAGKAMGKWVHAGRVNTPGRFEYFDDLGADSLDGTGLSRYSWMRKAIYEKSQRPELQLDGAA